MILKHVLFSLTKRYTKKKNKITSKLFHFCCTGPNETRKYFNNFLEAVVSALPVALGGDKSSLTAVGDLAQRSERCSYMRRH
jgi:hypothetical protein